MDRPRWGELGATGDVKTFRDPFFEGPLAAFGDGGPNEWDIHTLPLQAAPALVDPIGTDPSATPPLSATAG
ncbi:hypothetical protein [Streptomyces ipomoeae]|uniref:hypothetical protein n=1 Tax=Streptomyces ipomoeae TaxID=103232 RepID=UPI0015F12533|nr:hypothetical protein [Streptomyces ipomoeae]MDX2934521.1 hypothetical protein [Streptomyces ipomoeae]